MKKYLIILVLALLALGGCKDATAKVSNANEALITFGNTKITKGEVYEVLNRQDGFSTVLSNVRFTILDKEVETTQEMENSAKEKLEADKETYGEDFESYIKYNGFLTEEDYLNKYLIPNEKTSALTDAYIDGNWENILVSYYPAQVEMIECDEKAKATDAVTRLNGGESMESIANDLSTKSNDLYDGKVHVVSAADSSTLNSYIMDFIKNSNEPGTSQILENSAGDKFYLVRVVSKDALAFKQSAVESIKKASTLNNEMMAYYYKKYGFRTYDVSLRDYLRSYYPTYLNQ